MTICKDKEYGERLNRVKKSMLDRGVDVLFVSSPENIFYLTGYCGWSFYTPQGLIVTLSDALPFLILRDMDTACAEFSTNLPQSHVIGYPEFFIGNPDRHAMEFVAQQINMRASANARVAIEMETYFLSPKAFQVLQAGLPNLQLIDSDLLVNWVRTYKSDYELDIMRRSGEVAQAAMSVAIDKATIGIRECDLAADIRHAQTAGTPAYGGGGWTVLIMPSGERASAPHLLWTDAVYTGNTAINFELGGCVDNYHAGLSRTVFLGSPPSALVDLSKIVTEGINIAIDAARPGRTCEEVFEAWDGFIRSRGHEKSSRIGYSIGIGFQPVWIEHTASLQRGDRTELVPNMTFHMICGMWKGAHNMVVSETIIIKDGAAEVLSTLPRGMAVK
jgi:Xaa-Pro dipeptidase